MHMSINHFYYFTNVFQIYPITKTTVDLQAILIITIVTNYLINMLNMRVKIKIEALTVLLN